MSTEQTFCVNHPNTPTLLRCNRCGKPVCTRCIVKTPVGYRCRDCLHLQQAQYYNAGAIDYALAAGVGLVISAIAGAIMSALGGIFLLAIFAGPIGGSAISESIRLVLRRHRGRYIWLVGCATVILGGLLGAAILPFLAATGFAGRARPVDLLALPLGVFLNIGFLLYLALALSVVYARLKA